MNKKLLLCILFLGSSLSWAETGTWDTLAITTSENATAPPTGAGVLVADALTVLNTAAITNDPSLVTAAVLADAGLSSVEGIYLTNYQNSFSGASGVTGFNSAQGVIYATNNMSGPVAIATPAPTAAVENAVYSYTTPVSSFFSGNGALALSATGLPSWLSFDGVSFTGTPTVSGNHDINLVATDAAGASVVNTFNITITNVNDAPTVASASFNLAENAASGANLGTLSSSDEDGDSLTWTLTGVGAGNFTITSLGAILVASGASLDYETNPSYSISATANDGNGGSDSDTVTISITNVDEGGPVFAADTPSTSASTVVPGSSTPIHTFVVTDPDNDAVVFSITETGFNIDASSGVLTPTTVTSGTTNIVVTATANGVSATHTIAVAVQGAAEAIADSGISVTADQLSDVLPAAVLSDLTSNNNCGISGTSNCLSAFNAARDSSSCSLAGGADASNAQVSSYVNCVMREGNLAAIATVASTYTATSTASASAACSTSINLSVPSSCGHPQWSCAITGSPSPATGYSAISDSSLTLVHSFNGSPSTISYTVRATLGLYSPAFSQDFTYTETVPSYQPNTQKFTGNWSGVDAVGAWNSCVDKGGVLATSAQIFAASSLTSFNSSGLYITYNGNRTLTNYTSCSTGDHAGIYNNNNGSNSGWETLRHNGATRYKARDADGEIVLRSNSCKGSGAYRNATTTYWCADVPSSCPAN